MEKRKIKEEKDGLSMALVPQSSGKLKEFTFPIFFTKPAALILSILTLFICMSLFVIYTYKENQNLKKSIVAMNNINSDQKNLLDEKASEISQLKHKEDSLNDRMIEFMRKYTEMTDSYITNKTDRSGTSSDHAFFSDINELKTLLEDISAKSKNTGTASADLTETENKLKRYMESIPTLCPTSGDITSNFGERNDPFYFKKRYHEGIDIAASYDQDIKAAANGTVTFSGYYGSYGYVVFIDHGRGTTSIYGHTSELLVKKGQDVRQGDVIAKVGSSGRSTGPHLHFEVRINDEPVDPLKFLNSN